MALEAFKATLASQRPSDEWARWQALAQLVTLKFSPESAPRYRRYLIEYADARDVPEAMMRSLATPPESESDTSDDDAFSGPGGTDFYKGVHNVLLEYFRRPENYATNTRWTSQLVAYARNRHGDRVAVGIINLSMRDEARANDARKTMRIQGIIGCPLFRLFYHAPIGSAFLAVVERIARERDRLVLVSPIGKGVSAWARKLEAQKFVRVDAPLPVQVH